MPLSLPRGWRYPQSARWSSFNGGINLRDASSPEELGANDLVDSWNVTFDERGGASGRLGYNKLTSVPYSTTVQNLFWSGAIANGSQLYGNLVTNAGANLYLGSSNPQVIRKTFTTSERVTFAEIGTYLVACHPTDGLFTTTDGVTWSPVSDGLGVVTITIASPGVLTLTAHGLAVGDQVYLTTSGALPTGLVVNTVYFVQSVPSSSTFTLSATSGGAVINTSGSQSGTHHVAKGVVAPKGTCVATWQGKLWVGRPDGSVAWSAINNPKQWSATDFNNIWTKDGLPITALHLASGENIAGKPLLYAFKKESWYVIEDASTGAYSTVDATVGAFSNIAVVGVGPYVYAIGGHGIYRASGAQVGATNMSDKLSPLWSGILNLALPNLWCAGRYKNRAVFSLPLEASSGNNLALELHPEQGWIAPGSNAMTCYATSPPEIDLFYGGSVTSAGDSYRLVGGGTGIATDDGAAISGWFQTRWMDLLGGYKASVLHLHVRGRGTGTIEVRKDYQESGVSQSIDLSLAAGTDEAQTAVYSIGACRQLSLKFSFSTSTAAHSPAIFGGDSLPLGKFAVFQVEAMFTRIGIN